MSDVSSSGNKSKQGRQRTSASGAPPSIGGRRPGQTDEEADIEAAMLLSLAETSGAEGGPANIDNEVEMRSGFWRNHKLFIFALMVLHLYYLHQVSCSAGTLVQFFGKGPKL